MVAQMVHAFNPSTWEAEAGRSLEFEASLVYKVSSIKQKKKKKRKSADFGSTYSKIGKIQKRLACPLNKNDTHTHTHTHTHTYVTTVNDKEGTNLKESKEGYMRGFGRRKGKGEMINSIRISENKSNKNIKKRYVCILFCLVF